MISAKHKDMIYLFRVAVKVDESPMMDASTKKRCMAKGKSPWRDIAIKPSSSLYALAESIIDSFKFDFDHCFGFFSTDFKYPFYHDAKRQYELFADIPDVEPTGADSVEKTAIDQVWQKQGDKMVMLFDYGDMWWFTIELMSIEESKKGKRYPYVLRKEGASPQQYGY